jgi:hypothetical protein
MTSPAVLKNTRLAPWPCMLYPTNIFISSLSSTPCDRRQRSKILFWNYLSLISTKMIQSCKYIQLLANNFQPHQPTSNTMELFWNYSNLNYAEKVQSCRYIQILADPFSVLPKPFMWVDLPFGNYLIMLKAPPPSTTSLKESSVKISFRNSFPHCTSKLCAWTSLEGAFVEKEKFPTYHKLTHHTIKSTKYSQLQSTTYCC